MKKVLFIYSPNAGAKTILSHIDYIVKSHQNRGYFVTLFRFTKNDDVNDAMKLIDEHFEHILIAGGDGTINRVVNAMKRHDVDIPIATIPSGTANDFAKLLGYNSLIEAACEQTLSGKIKEIDLGLANGSYFTNILSAGLFTDVSQKTPTYLKNTFGRLAYYVNGVHELPNFRKMKIKIKGINLSIETNALIIFVFNGQTAGNFKIAQHSFIDDGLLDVLVIEANNIANSVQTIHHFLTRSKGKYPKGVIHFKASEFELESIYPINFDIDGESGPATPLHIKCIKNGLKVIVPTPVLSDSIF